MNTGELLNALCVRLPRQELYYLESQGLLHSKKHTVGRTDKRDWPEEAIPLLERYWVFREEGFTPKVAWEKATRQGRQDKES